MTVFDDTGSPFRLVVYIDYCSRSRRVKLMGDLIGGVCITSS